MSYTSRTFTDGQTFTAAHANEMKSEISELYSTTPGYCFMQTDTFDYFVSTILENDNSYGSFICSCQGGDISSTLTNGNSTSSLKGIVTKASSKMIDYILVCAAGQLIFTGRIESGEVIYAYKFTGTSVS